MEEERQDGGGQLYAAGGVSTRGTLGALPRRTEVERRSRVLVATPRLVVG